MTALPDLSQLTHEEKDVLIRALWAQVPERVNDFDTAGFRI